MNILIKTLPDLFEYIDTEEYEEYLDKHQTQLREIAMPLVIEYLSNRHRSKRPSWVIHVAEDIGNTKIENINYFRVQYDSWGGGPYLYVTETKESKKSILVFDYDDISEQDFVRLSISFKINTRMIRAGELCLKDIKILPICETLHLFDKGAIGDCGNIEYYERLQEYIKCVLETWDDSYEDEFDKKVREMCEIVVTYDMDPLKLC